MNCGSCSSDSKRECYIAKSPWLLALNSRLPSLGSLLPLTTSLAYDLVADFWGKRPFLHAKNATRLTQYGRNSILKGLLISDSFLLQTLMAYDVTLITGDGTGPELSEAARMCVDATGVKINWDIQEAGVDVMARTGTPLPDAVLESIKRTKCALKAPITTPVGTGFRSINVYLRQAFGLYACVRPCKIYPVCERTSVIYGRHCHHA